MKDILKKMIVFFKNEKGSALLTVLILLFIFAVIGSSVLLTTINNMSVSMRISEYEDTYYIAEANAQYALTFIKEEVGEYYMEMKGHKQVSEEEYIEALENFYPSLIERISTSDNFINTSRFNPIDFSDLGITTSVTIEMDPNAELPTGYYGTSGNPVAFYIESIAESDSSRRVVNAVLYIDDPGIEWHYTSVPPMTDRRILAGDDILSASQNTYLENAIICRGNVTTGNSLTDEFLDNHQSLSDTFTYDSNNSIPYFLKWELQFEKFPTNIVYDDFTSLFEASTINSTTYNAIEDWYYETVSYNILGYEPGYGPGEYSSQYIIDSSARKNDVPKYLDYYYDQSVIVDSRPSTKYVGTEDDQVRIYAIGSLELSGTKNIEHCYIFAEGDIKININGHIEDSIIISNGGSVTITCDYITNTKNKHKIIKANNDVKITLDEDSDLHYAVIRSVTGGIDIKHSSFDVTKNKVEMKNCYLYTDPSYVGAMIVLNNIYVNNSFVNAGKDLVLRNCSGLSSGFYAYGLTDADLALNSNQGYKYLYTGTTSTERQLDYLNYMQISIDRDYAKYFRGIIFITELIQANGTNNLTENTFTKCDFTTREDIFMASPRYTISTGNQMIDFSDCRLIADREVMIEHVTMNHCYVFAGIRGYENENSYYYIDGAIRYGVARGIYLRMDYSKTQLNNSVFYSRGKIIYSQHTPESDGFLITEQGKKRIGIDSTYPNEPGPCLFYSKDNFEYNGLVTSVSVDSSLMKYNNSLCNDMIIMTEASVAPHEFYPSAEDVLFIGGDMQIVTDPDVPYTSNRLITLYGDAGTSLSDLEVQSRTLFENYFEQKLNKDEILLFTPGFTDVFRYEDIYEKTQSENGG
ncbi:MAG: pilus assembly PilX N-terminal domain-containing protein [Clostridia bacterium]|nr:pilus assembly PilX N-terminal domain-containing protein [Clostridia bacterium]